MTSVRSMASLTGGLGERNSISTNTMSPLIVKQSIRRCEFSVDQMFKGRLKNRFNYLRAINLRRADYQEYKISEKDFKNLHPNDFEDLYDGTLTRIMEKLDHMVKDFHLFEYNKGMETRKWSEDDKRRSKDFITAIEKRLQNQKDLSQV
ncbi:hypothetical protein Tco_1576046 [Tanacetum coccineum]